MTGFAPSKMFAAGRVRGWLRLAVVGFLAPYLPGAAADARSPGAGLAAHVVEFAGQVEFQKVASQAWSNATYRLALLPGDRLRTGAGSRAAVQLSDRSVLRLGERTTLEIQPPRAAEKRRFGLRQGLLFFFNRERPTEVEFETPLVSGAIRGTEFVLQAGEAASFTELALLDGQVELTAAGERLALVGGERARVERGQPPVKSPLLEAVSVIQWALYYPAVIWPGDLALSDADRVALTGVLSHYEAGDLLSAREEMAAIPPGGQPRELLRAALDLSVGRVADAEERLGPVDNLFSTAQALRELLAVVRGHSGSMILGQPASASEWLARSYTWQARFQLREALAAATQAARLAPDFGFAHARFAELLLAFERREEALRALARALELSPRLAHAHALRGFAHLDELKPAAALAAFEQALQWDAGLPVAWLGRGLAQSRLRQPDEARRSLQTAAALDPRRALPRSYLAKAFSDQGEPVLAEKDFRLAKELDPADPTAWLYAALHQWRENRPNRAVRELERSIALNDHRQLFRSRLLLDRDLAVRQANLAALYQDAGLPERSLRLAASAVNDDYANFSGHLFLAHSYRALEDPNRFDLRFETARHSELLVANLLAPPGAANLSQLVSQQERLRFLDPRPFGASTWTEIRSNGDWRQDASLFGSFDGFSYAVDVALHRRSGTEINSTLQRRDVSLQLKQPVTDRDEVYLQAGLLDAQSGDVARHYDPAATKRDLRVDEEQLPNLQIGWHRAWSPASHTLLLLSRWTDDLRLRDTEPSILFLRQMNGAVTGVSTPPFFALDYASRFTLYSAEAQHLWQAERHGLVLGARGQWGEVKPEYTLDRALTGPVATGRFDDTLERANAYAYHQWRPVEPLRLVTGLSYDRLTHPLNSDLPPLTTGRATRDLLAPKAGLLFAPWRDGLFRASYSQSLGGVYFDHSVRLEPTQLAGFNQAFRSLLPESVAGLVPGTKFETANVGFDQALSSGTYLGVEAQWLRSDGDRVVGALTNSTPLPVPDAASSTRQKLGFRERHLSLYAVQLLGDGLSLGVRYRLSEARLEGEFPGIPSGATGLAQLSQRETSLLHQVALSLNYMHTSGWFAQWDSNWFHQDNDGHDPALPTEDVWQHHAFVGYRWPGRRAELRLGLLNLTDADYRLNPLNFYTAPPRERMAVASLRLNF